MSTVLRLRTLFGRRKFRTRALFRLPAMKAPKDFDCIMHSVRNGALGRNRARV